MKNIILTTIFSTLMLGVATASFAQKVNPEYKLVQSKIVDVRAEIPPLNALTVTVTKYFNNGRGGMTASGLDFGTLSYDPNSGRFNAGCYYAVDASVASNARSFTLTHKLLNNVLLVNGKETLDRNINVTFLKRLAFREGDKVDTSTAYCEVLLGRYSLADSNGKSYSSSVLTGKALRILYEIANGKNDAPGVMPITADKPMGQYKGQIMITLVQ